MTFLFEFWRFQAISSCPFLGYATRHSGSRPFNYYFGASALKHITCTACTPALASYPGPNPIFKSGCLQCVSYARKVFEN